MKDLEDDFKHKLTATGTNVLDQYQQNEVSSVRAKSFSTKYIVVSYLQEKVKKSLEKMNEVEKEILKLKEGITS